MPPAARITSHRLRTHTQSATAFRGFGGPQGVVGIERVMDQVRAKLGDRAILKGRALAPRHPPVPSSKKD